MSLLIKSLRKKQLQQITSKNAVKTNKSEHPPECFQKQLTIDDIANFLCISIGTARNIISKGSDFPPSYRAGRKRLFCPEAFKEWIEKKKSEFSD
jgi:hypothetical protein